MRLLVVGVLGLFACAEPAAWHGSTDFTSEERAEIETGRAWVCERLERDCLPIEWDRAPGDHSPGTIVRDESLNENGVVLPDGTIHIRPSTKFLRTVAAHEFGHWFGLPHTTDGFMAPSATTNDLQWPSEL